MSSTSSYERTYKGACEASNALISRGRTLDSYQSSRNNTLDAMRSYVKRIQIEEGLGSLSVIHVAGTKGKGSTCAFAESILRHHGLHTGLYTSPHLIDVCERFRLDGRPVSTDLYATHFWALWDDLEATKNHNDGYEEMPNLFRFYTLLAFRIFLEQKVDVAVLEVGIGGRLDATNVIRSPVVCGVSALGFDHMDILGHTLDLIATEKAGIFKSNVPAFTVPQPPDAMAALCAVAACVNAPLHLVPPLESFPSPDSSPLRLGLAGEHQRYNAALAVCLTNTWLQRTGRLPGLASSDPARTDATPPQQPCPAPTRPFALLPATLVGLAQCSWPGRGQTVPHPTRRNLTFLLDGAHTGESLEVCFNWFFSASDSLASPTRSHSHSPSASDLAAPPVTRVLLFNCSMEREAERLLGAVAGHAQVHALARVIFSPMVSSKPAFLPPHTLHTAPTHPSWQATLAACFESLVAEQSVAPPLPAVHVTTSLQESVEMIEALADQSAAAHGEVHVLVTGSLYIVGDVLKLLRWHL